MTTCKAQTSEKPDPNLSNSKAVLHHRCMRKPFHQDETGREDDHKLHKCRCGAMWG